MSVWSSWWESLEVLELAVNKSLSLQREMSKWPNYIFFKLLRTKLGIKLLSLLYNLENKYSGPQIWINFVTSGLNSKANESYSWFKRIWTKTLSLSLQLFVQSELDDSRMTQDKWSKFSVTEQNLLWRFLRHKPRSYQNNYTETVFWIQSSE